MQPVFTAMDAFEFPELHDESISANNFFRQLSKLLSASGVKDFSWRVSKHKTRCLAFGVHICHKMAATWLRMYAGLHLWFWITPNNAGMNTSFPHSDDIYSGLCNNLATFSKMQAMVWSLLIV